MNKNKIESYHETIYWNDLEFNEIDNKFIWNCPQCGDLSNFLENDLKV